MTKEQEKVLKEFDERFGSIHKDRPMPSGLETASKIKQFLLSALESQSSELKREIEGNWIIHEVHGEGGRMLDGETLYWAKVRKIKS